MAGTPEPLNTLNEFLVSAAGDGKVVILSDVRRRVLSSSQALMLAAYLVLLADGEERFPEYLTALKNT